MHVLIQPKAGKPRPWDIPGRGWGGPAGLPNSSLCHQLCQEAGIGQAGGAQTAPDTGPGDMSPESWAHWPPAPHRAALRGWGDERGGWAYIPSPSPFLFQGPGDRGEARQQSKSSLGLAGEPGAEAKQPPGEAGLTLSFPGVQWRRPVLRGEGSDLEVADPGLGSGLPAPCPGLSEEPRRCWSEGCDPASP